jgi:hypothetical protein
MTKAIGILLLLVCFAARHLGAGPYDQAVKRALNELGQPVVKMPRIETSADLRTTRLPEQVAAHQVVPRQFSEQMLNTIFRLTALERSNMVSRAARGSFGAPGVKYFGSFEKDQTLALNPAQGWIRYKNGQALHDKGNRSATAPGEEVLLPRALELAKVLGLMESDFARRPGENGYDFRLGKTERTSYQQPKRVVGRDIFLRRAIDGHPVVTGSLQGGLWFGIGINGVVHEFHLTARATQRSETRTVAPLPQQLTALAEARQVRIVHRPTDWEDAVKDQQAVLALDLVEIVYFEDAPEKIQHLIPPLLRWEGELKFRGQSNLVVLFTPVKQRL